MCFTGPIVLRSGALDLSDYTGVQYRFQHGEDLSVDSQEIRSTRLST
jgi:hypothetical protein